MVAHQHRIIYYHILVVQLAAKRADLRGPAISKQKLPSSNKGGLTSSETNKQTDLKFADLDWFYVVYDKGS